MNASEFWNHVDAALVDGETLEMTSERISGMLGKTITLHDIDLEFTALSDLGPVRCRIVDLMDIHHWSLRFWRSARVIVPLKAANEDTDSPQAA